MARFDTVVLFDVENLLGCAPAVEAAAASCRSATSWPSCQRRPSRAVGPFAVSRAYGNWGRSFMSTLRREMTENGIEPRQIFGFDRPAKKNAADIELVIDAMDLAYLRPDSSPTFVLVTRDGGFSARPQAPRARKGRRGLRRRGLLEGAARGGRRLHRPARPREGLPGDRREPQPSPHDRSSTGAADRASTRRARRVLAEIGAIAYREVTGSRPRRESSCRSSACTSAGDPVPGVVSPATGASRSSCKWRSSGTDICVIRDRRSSRAPETGLGPEGRAAGLRAAANHLGKRLPPCPSDQATLYRYLAGQGEPISAWPSRDDRAGARRGREVPTDGEELRQRSTARPPSSPERFRHRTSSSRCSRSIPAARRRACQQRS